MKRVLASRVELARLGSNSTPNGGVLITPRMKASVDVEGAGVDAEAGCTGAEEAVAGAEVVALVSVTGSATDL